MCRAILRLGKIWPVVSRRSPSPAEHLFPYAAAPAPWPLQQQPWGLFQHPTSDDHHVASCDISWAAAPANVSQWPVVDFCPAARPASFSALLTSAEMAAQLPPEVVAVAVVVLIYSLICLASGFFLLWLVWVHDERKSYVSMLAGLMTLHTVASIAQQIHTIARWRDIKTEQHANMVANVGDPELNITGGSTGLDLALFYIRTSSCHPETKPA